MRAISASFALILALTAACSSEEPTGTGGSGGASDGKYHPPGNGQRQKEADACDVLSEAQDERTQALSCTTTTRPCPTLIQVMVSGATCLEYDQGTVQGCADYYAKQTTCEAFTKAVADCVITSFSNSAPAGCP